MMTLILSRSYKAPVPTNVDGIMARNSFPLLGASAVHFRNVTAMIRRKCQRNNEAAK